MKIAIVAALALLVAPAFAQAQGTAAPCRYQRLAPSSETQLAGTLTVQMDTSCTQPGPESARRTMVSPPRNGAVVFAADGTMRYAPRRSFVGSDVFQYAVVDPGNPALPRRTLTINVVVQREPVAAAAPASSAPPGWPGCRVSDWQVGGTNAPMEYGTGTMQARAGNRCWMRINLQGVTVHVDRPPSHGQVIIDGPQVGYTSETGYSGSDSFTVRWSRGDQVRRLVMTIEVR
jgi:hypothetical protein